MATLRVLVADDHKLMLEALRLALADAEGIELVGLTSEGTKVVPLAGVALKLTTPAGSLALAM